MPIKSAIWFSTAFDMGIHPKPLIVSSALLIIFPSSKLVMGHLVLDQTERVDSYSHQIFANRNSRWNEKGAERHVEQPEIFFLELFRCYIFSSSNQ